MLENANASKEGKASILGRKLIFRLYDLQGGKFFELFSKISDKWIKKNY